MLHDIRFYRNKSEPGYFARCSCEWFSSDVDLTELQTRAAVHDLDDTPAELPQGFVSGLE